MKDITVVLLAGGKSSRFWPLPNKLTLPFLGQTLLKYQIDLLKKSGFTQIILVTSPEIASRFSGENIRIVVQKGEGMGAAVLSTSKYIENKAVLVVITDDLADKSLYETLYKETQQSRSNFLVGYKTTSYYPGGYLVLKGKNVTRIIEKPGAGNEPSKYVNISDHFFLDGTKLVHFLKQTEKEDPIDAYEKGISLMMKAGEIFEMIEYTGHFVTMKFPWQTLDAMDYFLGTINKSSISKQAYIHKSTSIVGPVVIEKGVRVMEYAKLVGPLYVGPRTIIGNHTMVRHSMIGEDCVVGFGSDIARSYIGNGSWFHTNYIGDSVIADDVAMGAGAVMANLRLDEGEIYSNVKGERINTHRVKLGVMIGEGTRVGIEAKLMPGVKIGENSVLGAGVLLQQDVPDAKRVYVKQSYTVEENSTSNVSSREKFRQKI